jgi:hypothetical protein
MVDFVLVYLTEIWLQSLRDFSREIYFINKYYKFCNFSTLCKHNTAILLCPTQKSFIPFNSDESYCASN